MRWEGGDALQAIECVACEKPRSQETDLWGDAQFLRANEERATPVMACPLSQHRERGLFVEPSTERVWMCLDQYSIWQCGQIRRTLRLHCLGGFISCEAQRFRLCATPWHLSCSSS